MAVGARAVIMGGKRALLMIPRETEQVDEWVQGTDGSKSSRKWGYSYTTFLEVRIFSFCKIMALFHKVI